jgi:hypothetical protein
MSAVGQLYLDDWPFYFSLATCKPFFDYWPPDNFTTSRFIARLSSFLPDNCLIMSAYLTAVKNYMAGYLTGGKNVLGPPI